MSQPSDPVLACPACHGMLVQQGSGAVCQDCGATYPSLHGYLAFPVNAGGALEESPRLESYAERQEAAGDRFTREYLSSWLSSWMGSKGRILDAGCGIGEVSTLLGGQGFEAWGLDLPKLAGFWEELRRDPGRFVSGDATALPFATAAFDAVLSLGVLEHVGTVAGHVTLAPDYRSRREAFAAELLRVTRPGGRLLVACPNKHFPVDLHHGPSDAARAAAPWRERLARRTGANVHPVWGDYHLPSYGEVRRLFVGPGRARAMRALPARGYFAFESVPRGLRSGARAWTERMPGSLRETFLNPFVIAEIRV